MIRESCGSKTREGKKFLTAKDPQGKLLFSGPVETKEDLDKVPAEVRQRYDKLQSSMIYGQWRRMICGPNLEGDTTTTRTT